MFYFIRLSTNGPGCFLFVVWPASLSVMASCLAAPFVLGVPAEIYAYGIDFAALVIGYMIGVPIVTHIFFNRFYTMDITSVYEVGTCLMFIFLLR